MEKDIFGDVQFKVMLEVILVEGLGLLQLIFQICLISIDYYSKLKLQIFFIMLIVGII